MFPRQVGPWLAYMGQDVVWSSSSLGFGMTSASNQLNKYWVIKVLTDSFLEHRMSFIQITILILNQVVVLLKWVIVDKCQRAVKLFKPFLKQSHSIHPNSISNLVNSSSCISSWDVQGCPSFFSLSKPWHMEGPWLFLCSSV